LNIDENKYHVRIELGNSHSTHSKSITSKTNGTKCTDEQSSSIVRGKKSQLITSEHLDKINHEIRAARQYVHDLKDVSHFKQRQQAADQRENKTVRRQSIRHHTFDDRLLRTLHGNMAIGCLVTVDKAYADRHKIEQHERLVRHIEQSQREHSLITDNVRVSSSIVNQYDSTVCVRFFFEVFRSMFILSFDELFIEL
jgi:hypothetical protein